MSEKVDKNISSVIFDLGGVLFDIDYALTQKAFISLGAPANFNEIYSQQKQAGFLDEFEKGNISVQEFRKQMKQWLPGQVSDDDIDRAWNTMLIGVPHSKIHLLKVLGKKYRLFLLSNTNEIHLPEVIKMMAHLDDHKGIEHLFENYYYSCKMGMRKPDKEIFDKVCRDNSIVASETLFVDDSIQNIEGAKKAGLKVLHCTTLIDLAEYFN
jgi:putative hydrolase of the HAD superfamily